MPPGGRHAIEYHSARDGAAVKAPDDFVTLDLAIRTVAHYPANDLGTPAAAKQARALQQKPAKKNR